MMARHTDTVTLQRKPWEVPAIIDAAGEPVVPFFAGEQLPWSLG